ncbi:ankyrin repeat-containing domain protein [Ilyonectria destructans]|nr:ankyrin repeat-containing domain protein [Ilyonectria destructans]
MSYAPRIPNAQWDAHKEQIRALYLAEDKTLDQTIEIMRERHGFSATDKQYVRKLKAWGMKKNVSSHQWKQSVSLVQKRKALGKETKLTIDGMVISAKKMKKEMGRYSYPQYGHGGMSAVSTSTSLGIIAYTPPSDNAPRVFLDTMPWLRFQSSVESVLSSPGTKFLLSRLEISLASGGGCPIKFRMRRQRDTFSGIHYYTDIPSTIPLGLKEKIGTQCKNGQAQQLVQSQPMLQLLHHTVYVSSNSLVSEEKMEQLVQWIVENEYTWAVERFIQLKGPSLAVFASNLLVAATRLGNVDFARMLLIQGTNPNSVGKIGRSRYLVFGTVLKIAGQRRDPRLVELLLRFGADPNDSGDADHTILDDFWSTIHSGHATNHTIHIIEILIEAGGRVTHIDPTSPRSWLAVSIKSGSFRLIELLQEAASHIKESASLANMKMQFAIERDQFEMVQGLVDQGAEVNCFSYHYKEDPHPYEDEPHLFSFPRLTRPIALAAKQNNLKMTQLLLNLGADANSIAPWDCPPAHMDNRLAQEDQLRYFLKYGPQPALHHATWNGNVSMVELLLQHGADIHLKDYFGCTPLQTACRSNHLDVVRVLLSWGASVDETTLHAASQGTSSAVLELLLFHGPNADFNPLLDYGTAALSAAVEIQSIDLVTALLQAGAYLDPMSFHVAVRKHRGSAQIVKCLLDAGASVDVANCNAANCECSPSYPTTPLQMAVGQRNLELVNLLLQYGADISHVKGVCPWNHFQGFKEHPVWHEIVLTLLNHGVDINGHGSAKGATTFLRDAVENENPAVMELLLDRGADPTERTDSDVPALYLSFVLVSNELANMEFLNAFISHGANVNGYAPIPVNYLEGRFEYDRVDRFFSCARGTYLQVTPLQLAAFCSLDDSVNLLLQTGADINSPPAKDFGFTALQLAIFVGQSEFVIKELLESGANINSPAASEIGFTALQAAILADNNELALRLLNAGADIDAPASSRKGMTSLQAAAFKDNDQLMEALLSRNPNINAPPCRMNGATALQYAAIRGNFDVVLQLLEKGADINAAPSEEGGRTALQGAAEHGRLDIVHLLLENDHDVEFLEERCHQAADFADEEGHREIAKILRNWERP